MLKDHLVGPDWILWILFVILAVISIILLTGHGESLISGFNTASDEEKEQYDRKKMSRIGGVYMSVISLLILAMAIFIDVLPLWFRYIFFGVVVVGLIVTIVLFKKVCKKKP
jgi:membrane protein implicated in regulation of membrane protease activity